MEPIPFQEKFFLRGMLVIGLLTVSAIALRAMGYVEPMPEPPPHVAAGWSPSSGGDDFGVLLVRVHGSKCLREGCPRYPKGYFQNKGE